MELYELVLVRPDGTEEVIKKDLGEREAIRYFEGIDNTYYREQKGTKRSRNGY